MASRKELWVLRQHIICILVAGLLLHSGFGDDGQNNRIALYSRGMVELPELITWYTRVHPGQQFFECKPEPTASKFLVPLSGSDADILLHEGEFWPEQREQLQQIYPDGYDGDIIGYRALLVLVHPDNPLNSLTLEQLQSIASHDINNWNDFGWDCGEKIVKRMRYVGGDIIRDGLFGGKEYKHYGPLKFNPKGHTQEEISVAYGLATRLRKCQYPSYMELYRDAANDKYGITFVLAQPGAYQSGLKVLSIAQFGGQPAEPTPENIISGAYPARLAVKCWVAPRASKQGREFAKWLRGKSAAKFFAADCVYGPAYLDEYNETKHRKNNCRYRYPETGAKIQPDVKGAVAVLPMTVSNEYYVLLTPPLAANYTAVIEQAVAKSGGLKLVDRQAIDAIFEEKVLTGPGEKIISADIFIQPTLVVIDNEPVLKIFAYHGPTASLLGEVSRPMNSFTAGKFDEELCQEIMQWYPSVVEQLSRIRKMSIWSLPQIFAYGGPQEAVDGFRLKLQNVLSKERAFFLAGYSPFMPSYKELWMNRLGVGRQLAGSFVPAADWIIQGRFVAKDKLQMRIISGKNLLAVAAKTFGGQQDEMLVSVRKWILEQADRVDTDKSPKNPSDIDDFARENWAAMQAKHELKLFEQAYAKIPQVSDPSMLNDVNGNTGEIMPDETPAVKSQKQLCYRISNRAFLLDSSNVDVVRARIKAINLFAYRNKYIVYTQLADAYGFYALNFPDTSDNRAAAEYALVNMSYRLQFLDKYCMEPGVTGAGRAITRKKLARDIFNDMFEIYRYYARKYAGCWDSQKMQRGSWSRYILPGQFMYNLSLYFTFVSNDKNEMKEAIDFWHDTFDKYPQNFPCSDFLYLNIVAFQGKRAEFLAKVKEMIEKHPDSKSEYWKHGTEMVQREMCDLFPGNETSKYSFYRWVQGQGKGPVGELPYYGYKDDGGPRRELPWRLK